MRGPVGWQFAVWAVTGQAARMFGDDMRAPAVDALSNYSTWSVEFETVT